MCLGARIEIPADCVRADLPHEPAPQRVVEVGDQAFLSRGRQQDLGASLRQQRGVADRVRKAGADVGSQVAWRDHFGTVRHKCFGATTRMPGASTSRAVKSASKRFKRAGSRPMQARLPS